MRTASLAGFLAAQVEVNVMAPVHRHRPFIQAPFWLQLKAHVFLAEQYNEKSLVQVRVPSKPGTLGKTWPGVLHTSV